MKKAILIFVASALLFSFFAFAFYPKPAEIITLFVGGMAILLLLIAGYEKIGGEALEKEDYRRTVINYLYQAVSALYIVVFLLVFRVSWFENKIVFNIFQTQRGKAYIVITVGAVLIVAIYYLVFFKKHKRWPTRKELGFKDRI